MRRRGFLLGSAAASAMAVSGVRAQASGDAPVFATKNAAWQKGYDSALAVLAANVQVMPPHPYGRFDGPVQIGRAHV